MTIWKYEEKTGSHRLVKLYAEEHGEGECLGDLNEEELRELVASFHPKIGVDAALQQLRYFGFLPLLIKD